jgi:hypothetical protein
MTYEEAKRYQEYSTGFINWYWSHGHSRGGKYALRTGDWLDSLYRVSKDLDRLSAALQETRPAVAIWGPSQTGKSTLVSKYIDANVTIVGDVSKDGSNSALHWPGGSPAFFLFPYDKRDLFQPDSLVLNPFNSGLDASACLSRFVLGSREPAPGRYLVRDPQYPVEVRLVKPFELWASIARGYDSQCLGPKPPEHVRGPDGQPLPRRPTIWTQDKFRKVLDNYRNKPAPRGAKPDQRAYDYLNDFCDLIEDMIFADVERFRQLQTAESQWQEIRFEILNTGDDDKRPNALLCSYEQAEEFCAQILWDGYEILTSYFRRMRQMYEDFNQRYGGKPIHCSLEVAALFLDMETYKNFLVPAPSNADARDDRVRKILRTHRTVPAISVQEREDCVIWGCEQGLGQRLIESPEDFASMQGLVWELVVPLNPDNLNETSFKGFLEGADVLDFPGVERGGKGSDADKVDLDVMTRLRGQGKMNAGPADGESAEASSPLQFFVRILKRGKTSSIVNTYAQRQTIDIFNIFQDLDRDKPNGNELITGIRTWWKCSAPQYFANPKGPSPLPLNFVLLWWATFFNEGHDLQNLQKKYTVLGPIADPEISTTFALNYYSIYRGKILPEKLPELETLVNRTKNEPVFRKQFRSDVSRESFDTMIADRTTGGTEYFFIQLGRQVLGAGAGPDSARGRLLLEKMEACIAELVELMKRHEIMPDPKPKDVRREQLEAFRERLLASIQEKGETEMRSVNHALRQLLNVVPTDLGSIPGDIMRIDAGYVREQFERWVSLQIDRFTRDGSAFRGGDPLALLNCQNREDLYNFLNSLIQSLEPDYPNIAAWLVRLMRHLSANPDASVDTRRYLALKMGNMLAYGPAGPRVGEELDDPGAAEEDEEEGEARLGRTLKGRECTYYRYYPQPVPGLGRLSQLPCHPADQARAQARPAR